MTPFSIHYSYCPQCRTLRLCSLGYALAQGEAEASSRTTQKRCRSCAEWFTPESPEDHVCDKCLWPEKYQDAGELVQQGKEKEE